ncbi:hypothetical protein Tco_0834735 [Tanacetum coccineum]
MGGKECMAVSSFRIEMLSTEVNLDCMTNNISISTAQELKSMICSPSSMSLCDIDSSAALSLHVQKGFEYRCTWVTGNRAHLEDYQELSKVGSVTFGGSKVLRKVQQTPNMYTLDRKNEVRSLYFKNLNKLVKVILWRGLPQEFSKDTTGVACQRKATLRLFNPTGSKEVIGIDVQTEEAEELLVVSFTSRKAVVSETLLQR